MRIRKQSKSQSGFSFLKVVTISIVFVIVFIPQRRIIKIGVGGKGQGHNAFEGLAVVDRACRVVWIDYNNRTRPFRDERLEIRNVRVRLSRRVVVVFGAG